MRFASQRLLLASCALALFPIMACAQTPPPVPARPGDTKGADTKVAPPKPAPKPGALKAYSDVVTGDAKTQSGLFMVHRIEDKIYFEIPANLLEKDMLWYSEIAQISPTFGRSLYPGAALGRRVVRWTRRNNRIFLRDVSFQSRADKGAIAEGVRDITLPPIILAFDIETEGKDKSAVIDVTRLFTGDIPEFSPKQSLGGVGLDPARTYVDTVKAFPTNIETKVLMTYVSTGLRGSGSVTALVHHSMDLLPDRPMPGRYFDSRVGYFTVGFNDYSSDENRVVPREFITRYRLEKKDPTARLSEPVRPLVYYIGREVPEEWRPYLKLAVQDWNEAFQQAGFINAIQCRDAPTEKEDPGWDAEDARYSVIRWAPLPIENAMGPSLVDPRSGEILSAHIIVWHDVLKLAQAWYFVQVGPLDPRAQKLPLPKELMGDLIRYVVCHEVGHTLGLRHNHKASASFTCAELRDPKFTALYGDEASIMDYGRFNYVAQPGDNARLIPKIGPYDRFAIEWGYTLLPNVTSPEAEKTYLDAIAARQVTDPTLRFGGEDENSVTDPTVEMEDLGSDPIEATTYGLKNIHRVAGMLLPATTKLGEDYSLLNDTYNSLLGQRLTELLHVAKLVGGATETDYHAGRGGVMYQPVPGGKQRQAVRFLLANAFTTPKDLIDPNILYRLRPFGVTDRVIGGERYLLQSLFEDSRVKQLEDTEAMEPKQAYTVSDMVTDVQSGIWSELAQPHPVIDLFRRNLQRSYIEVLRPKLVGDAITQTELRPVALGALTTLAGLLNRAIANTSDHDTLLHLRDCRSQVDRILHPRS